LASHIAIAGVSAQQSRLALTDGTESLDGGDGDDANLASKSFFVVDAPSEVNKRIGQIVTLAVDYTLTAASSPSGISCSFGISKIGYQSVKSSERSAYSESEFIWRITGPLQVEENTYVCRMLWETNLSTDTGYHVFAAKIIKSDTTLYSFPSVTSVKVIDTEGNGTIKLNVSNTTARQGESVRLSGQVSGIDTSNSAKSCYFYVGSHTGTSGDYVFKGKSPLSDCSYDWNTSGTAEGLRNVLVNIQNTSESSPTWSRLPSDTESIRICAPGSGACNAPNKISIWAEPASVNQGKTIKIHVYISNPNDAELANKQEYYLFVGDGNGRHYMKAHGAISSCSANESGCVYEWNTDSNTVVGLHSVVVSLQTSGLSSPAVFATPNKQTNVRVCPQNTSATCAAPNQGSNEGEGGPGTNPGGGTGEAAVTREPAPDLNPGVRGGDGKPTPANTGVDPTGLAAITELNFSTLYEFLKVIAFDWFPIIIGVAAFIGILIAGFTIITAGGDAEKAKKGRLAIVYIATGMILATLTWAFIRVVVNELLKLGFFGPR